MITFDNGNCLIVLTTKRMMRKHVFYELKELMSKEVINYLMGNTNTLIAKIIDRFINIYKLKTLSRNINKYIKNKKLYLSEEQILQVFFDRKLLVSFLIDLKSLNKFLKKLSTKELFIILGIKDFIKLDLENNSFYNVLKDKPEYYLRWKHI